MNLLVWYRSLMRSVGATLVKLIATATSGLVSFTTNVIRPVKVTCEFSPVQEGTGDPSPDNVRPISGWTGCEITGTRKNLFFANINRVKEYSPSNWNGNTKVSGNVTFECIVDANDNITEVRATSSGESSSNRFLYLPVDAFPNGRFTLNGIPDNMADNEGYIGYNLHGIDAYYYPHFSSGVTFNVTNPLKANRRLWLTVREGLGKTFVFRPQIRVATDSDASYESYQGQSLPITFTDPSTGDPMTIYGGTVTLNEDGSADLVSEYGIIDMSVPDLNYGYNNKFYIEPKGMMNYRTGIRNIVCEVYSAQSPQSVYANHDKSVWIYSNGGFHRIIIQDSDYYSGGTADKAGMKAWLTGKNIAYPLATPGTYHFDNIGQLNAFLQNNIWHNMNGGITAEYWNKQ